MPEAVEEDDAVERLDSLSDKEIKERGKKSLDRFKDKLREYSE